MLPYLSKYPALGHMLSEFLLVLSLSSHVEPRAPEAGRVSHAALLSDSRRGCGCHSLRLVLDVPASEAVVPAAARAVTGTVPPSQDHLYTREYSLEMFLGRSGLFRITVQLLM